LKLEVLEDRTAPALLIVTSSADTHQTGLLTLREALTQANTDATGGQSDTIQFDSALAGATITLTGGPLELSGASSTATEMIDGGRLIILSGNNASRVFTVDTGVTATLAGLTLTNGNATNGSGGGLYNAGTLTVTATTLAGNFATDGGGLYNGGTLTLQGSTLAGNSALYGGGIENDGTLTVSDSTLWGNSATSFGGGLWTTAFAPAAVTLTNDTITANRADAAGLGGQGGGLFVDPGSTAAPVLHNTLIGGNLGGVSGTSPDDVDGALDGGSNFNLIGDGSGMTGINDGAGGNQVGSASNPIDPLLGPLSNHGGPTQTVPLMAGSPALDTGDSGQLGTTDQRGVVRSGGVNIGAYQASASAFVLTAPATVTAGTAFDLTVQAVDPFSQTAAGYTGTVTFSSTDAQAVLPGNYTFKIADAGVVPFTGLTTLLSAGDQTVALADTTAGSITGSAAVFVNPAAADHLLLLQRPTDTAAGETISPAPIVAVADRFGNIVTSANIDTVTLSIGVNPVGGTLSGTLSVVVMNGVATFRDLSIDLAATGYTLHATIGGSLPDIDSSSFNIA
jgi:hypothetical protein